MTILTQDLLLNKFRPRRKGKNFYVAVQATILSKLCGKI